MPSAGVLRLDGRRHEGGALRRARRVARSVCRGTVPPQGARDRGAALRVSEARRNRARRVDRARGRSTRPGAPACLHPLRRGTGGLRTDGGGLAHADRLERDAANPPDDLLRASARLVRATAEWLAGDAAKANAYAKEARTLLKGAPDSKGASDPYLAYLAAMTIGVTARSRGQVEEALGSLQEAMTMAERDDDAHRRSGALYQLSTLYLVLKQPQNALDASRQAYRFAELAGSTPGMVKARMAESAALEVLDRPGAGTGRNGRGPCPRPQVALAGRRESRAHQSRRHQAAAQAIQRCPRSLAPVACARQRVQRRGADRDQQSQHRIRAVRARTHGRRQTLRRRGARRLRAHGRDRRDRRAACRVWPVSGTGRGLQDRAGVFPSGASAAR